MIQTLTSPSNPWLKSLRHLIRDNQAYKQQGLVWLEGDHLVAAVVRHHAIVEALVCAQSYWPSVPSAWVSLGRRQVLLPDALFKSISGLESAARIGVVLNKPTCPELNPSLASVILDRVQDAGNVGSILRSAAAMGFTQILALHGTAGLWSPKVLRAAVGAHLSLQLHEDLCVDDLDALDIPILCTSSHQGQYLHEFDQSQPLPNTVAWAFGHEGQGLGPQVRQRAARHIRIAQPNGQESLNVAAAAAVCLHASAVRGTI